MLRSPRSASWRRNVRADLRTFVLALLLGVMGLVVPRPASAQENRRDRTYLTQAALTLEGARRLILWVETHPNDVDLARFAYPLAERYVEMAGHLTPTSKLAVAHPHLLLVVENVERAIDAAGLGEMAVFRQRARTVREELAILDNVLKQLKVKLPELSR